MGYTTNAKELNVTYDWEQVLGREVNFQAPVPVWVRDVSRQLDEMFAALLSMAKKLYVVLAFLVLSCSFCCFPCCGYCSRPVQPRTGRRPSQCSRVPSAG